MEKGLYGFKDSYQKSAFCDRSKRMTDSLSLFFEDPEEYDSWRLKQSHLMPTRTMPSVCEMASYMYNSPSISIEKLKSLEDHPLRCRDCMYDLCIVTRPLYVEDGVSRLNAFSIFAYVEEVDEMIGVLSGFQTMSDDIVEFYEGISDQLRQSVCARSWRIFAERTFPELHEIYDLADEIVPVDLQQQILEHIQGLIALQHNTTSVPLVLVSDIYIDKQMREHGVLSHMLAALDVMFGEHYQGLFYLTPKKSKEFSAAFDSIPLFNEYDQAEYDLALNLELAKKYHMDVIGEERPIGIINTINSSVA